jgi:hypothetical protein
MAKGKAKRDGADGQAQDQQKVQAILLADSFNTNFRPISYEMPKVSALHPRQCTPSCLDPHRVVTTIANCAWYDCRCCVRL